MVAPNRIIQISGANGTFLGGYTGYSLDQLWTTIISDYLGGYGHFAATDQYGWDSNGSPYMALIDKSTMEILSTDALDLMNNFSEATLGPCWEMAP